MKTLLYTPGRTDAMIKLKASRNDREALVLNFSENGSVFLKLPEGIIFEANNSEIQKLKIGDIVTFSFSGYSNIGRPTDVEITKLRTDVTWHDVVLDSINSVTAQSVTEITNKVMSGESVESDKYPYGYWTMDSGINTKIFFEKFAEKYNFSPLVAEDWYSFADKVFLEEDSASVLHQYNNSVVSALQDVYDIPFESSRFSPLARKYWHKENRRRHFDNFANQKRREGHFDPQTSWYSLEKNILVDKNLGPIVKFCYGGSVAKAVIDLYPELQLDYFQFDNRNTSNNRSYSKQFFNCLAEKLNFDPLLPHNWYHIPLSTIREEKGGESLLYFFEGSLAKALSFSFPDIEFHEYNFDHFSKSFLESKENRKRVLDSFALLHGLDPRNSDNWNYYLENYSNPASRSVINYYNGNVVAALADIYHFNDYHPLPPRPKKVLYHTTHQTNDISHNEHYVSELLKKYPTLYAKK